MSTPYPPTTSESSIGSSSERFLDSSSPFPRPSCRRCRSPTALVPSSTHVSRSIAPTLSDLLPPRKRFRDSYSSEDSEEEHMEVDTADAEVVAYVGDMCGYFKYHMKKAKMGQSRAWEWNEHGKLKPKACGYFKYHMKKAKMGQSRAQEWNEHGKLKLKAYPSFMDQPGPTKWAGSAHYP
ncbi:hypothetical protein Tco_1285834 [Tanacetum coccineum]